MVSNLLTILRHNWWRILLFLLATMVLAVVVTRHMPWEKEFEMRIDLRPRGYGLDLYQPDKALDSLGIARVDAFHMVDSLYALAPLSDILCFDISCDKTQHISIRIHHVEAGWVLTLYYGMVERIDQRQFEILTTETCPQYPPARGAVLVYTFVISLLLALGVAMLKSFSPRESA